MRKILAFSIILLFAFIFFKPSATYSDYATCDVCGYCPSANPTPPTNWKQCVQCMYPKLYPTNIVPNPADKKSLEINSATNLAPKPAEGRQYTLIGCIRTGGGLTSFSSKGAAQSLTSVLLSFTFELTGGLAFLYLLYGSFLIATSQSSMEKLSRGKNVVYSAILGLIFSLSSVFIIKIIASGILRIPGFS